MFNDLWNRWQGPRLTDVTHTSGPVCVVQKKERKKFLLAVKNSFYWPVQLAVYRQQYKRIALLATSFGDDVALSRIYFGSRGSTNFWSQARITNRAEPLKVRDPYLRTVRPKLFWHAQGQIIREMKLKLSFIRQAHWKRSQRYKTFEPKEQKERPRNEQGTLHCVLNIWFFTTTTKLLGHCAETCPQSISNIPKVGQKKRLAFKNELNGKTSHKTFYIGSSKEKRVSSVDRTKKPI